MWTVIIPAYNEEGRIGATIEAVKSYARDRSLDVEILVVNDGSTDSTARVAAAHEGIEVLGSKTNRGKGWAVREGMKRARGEVVLFTDADMSTPIEEADRLIEWIKKGYDMAVGSRMASPRRIDRYQPPHRMVLGLGFGLVVRLLFSPRIRDTQCGFKMFTSRAARMLAPRMTIDGYTFDVEMLVLARRMGLRVAEVAVRWRDVRGSKLKVLRDFPRILKELAAIRRRLKKAEDAEQRGKQH